MEQVKSFSTRTWLIIFVIGVVGLVFLLRDHRTHIYSAVPYVILLLCPLLHIFMHKGHGGNDHSSEHKG